MISKKFYTEICIIILNLNNIQCKTRPFKVLVFIACTHYIFYFDSMGWLVYWRNWLQMKTVSICKSLNIIWWYRKFLILQFATQYLPIQDETSKSSDIHLICSLRTDKNFNTKKPSLIKWSQYSIVTCILSIHNLIAIMLLITYD